MCLVYLVIRKHTASVKKWLLMVTDNTLDMIDMLGYLH